MSSTHLKLYRGPQETEVAPQIAEAQTPEDCVTVSIGEVLPLIADAVNSERTWLSDFEHDDSTVSRDRKSVV